jgi:hypothetical protein
MARHILSEMAVLKGAEPERRDAAEGAGSGLHREEIGGGKKYRGRKRIVIKSVMKGLRSLVELVDCKRRSCNKTTDTDHVQPEGP